MLAARQKVTSGLRQDFFFPEELAGSSMCGSSPRAASGSNGIFLAKPKLVGELVLFLFSSLGVGGKGKHVDKGQPGTEESRPPESLRQDSTPNIIYKIESPSIGRGFVTGAGLA